MNGKILYGIRMFILIILRMNRSIIPQINNKIKTRSLVYTAFILPPTKLFYPYKLNPADEGGVAKTHLNTSRRQY